MEPNVYRYLQSNDPEMFYLGCILFVENMQDVTDYTRLKDSFVYRKATPSRITRIIGTHTPGRGRIIYHNYILDVFQRREILRKAQAKHLELLKKLKNEKERT